MLPLAYKAHSLEWGYISLRISHWKSQGGSDIYFLLLKFYFWNRISEIFILFKNADYIVNISVSISG